MSEAQAAASGRIGVIDLGPADALAAVLLHGLGGVAEEILMPLRQELLARGLRIVAVDRPGYGRSEALPPMGPVAQAAWLGLLLDRLGLSRPLVVAHSFGAAVALWLARQTDLAGLVLVNPFCAPTRPAAAPFLRLALAPLLGPPIRRTVAPAIAPRLLRWSLLKACAPDQPPPALYALPARIMAQESAVLSMGAELAAFNADMAGLSAERRSRHMPAAVLTGAQDRVIDGEAHGAWLERLGLPRRSVPGGHMLHHTRTDQVVRAVHEVLAA